MLNRETLRDYAWEISALEAVIFELTAHYFLHPSRLLRSIIRDQEEQLADLRAEAYAAVMGEAVDA